MAITARAEGTWQDLTADAAVAIPSGTVDGDMMYLLALWKPFGTTAQVTSPAGWTELTEFTDGAVANGNGVGSVKVACWYKEFKTGDTDPTLDMSASANTGGAVMISFQKSATETWDTPRFVTAAMTNWTTSSQTVTASTTPRIRIGDLIIGLIGIRDDSATMTRPSTGIAAGAITFTGNYVEYPATHHTTSTGFDSSGDAGYRIASSSGSAAPTMTGTISAAETGAALWILTGITTPGFGQAQAAIKAFDVGAFGQAQACVKGNAYGQAQASIKAIDVEGFGQAQAYIRPRVGLGQAQGFITKLRGQGQAQGLILGAFTSVDDTFTRSVTDGLGTADVGGAYTKALGTAANADVNGSQLIFQQDAVGLYYDLRETLHPPKITVKVQFSLSALPPSSNADLNIGLFKGTPDVLSASNKITIRINSVGDLFASCGVATPTVTYTPGDTYNLIAQLFFIGLTNNAVRIKIWKVGDTELGWTNSPSGIIAAADELGGGHPSIGSGSTTGTGIWTVDNFQIFADTQSNYGQAQARIKQTYNSYGQAQADIKQTYPLSPYARIIKSDSPIAYFRLGESSGTVMTDETGTHTGTYEGSPSLNQLGALTNDSNTSVAFDGTTGANYGKVAAWLTMPAKPVTLETWVKHDGITWPIDGYLGGWLRTDLTQSLQFYANGNGSSTIILRIGTEVGNANADATAYLAGGAWLHIVGTIDSGGNARLYFNGALVAGPNATSYVGGASDNSFKISTAGPDWPAIASFASWPGNLDEWAVYDYELTATDILEHYNARNGTLIGPFGQAQAEIVTVAITDQAYAQAQADIKATSNSYAQAQAKINAFDTEGFGQANAYIMVLVAADNFQRSEAGGWGTSTPTGEIVWVDRSEIIPGTTDTGTVDGSAGIVPTSSTIEKWGNFPNNDFSNHGYPLLVNGIVQYDFWISATADNSGTIDIDSYFGNLRVAPKQAPWTTWTAGSNFGSPTVSIDFIPDSSSWYTVKYTTLPKTGGVQRIKVWKTGTAEPAWQVETSQTGVDTPLYWYTEGFTAEDQKIDNLFMWRLDSGLLHMVSAQAAATIITTTPNASVQALITLYDSVTDTATRSVSNSLGTADVGGTYTLLAGTAAQWDVDGSKITFTSSNTTLTTQQLRQVLTPAITETNIEITRVSAGAGTGTSVLRVYSAAVTTGTISGIDARLSVNNATNTVSLLVNGVSSVVVGTWTVGDTWNLKFQTLRTTGGSNFLNINYVTVRAKAWKVGDVEPGWQTSTSAQNDKPFTSPSLTVGQGNSTTQFAFDNFNLFTIGWTETGQAQAEIVTVATTEYQAYAQGQAWIKVTDIEGCGQAQADIKQTYNSYAQAQAQIKQIYQAYAQAQAQIKQTYQGYAQTQAWIEQTYNAFAQAQADIKQTYNAFAQAQAKIATTRVYGQAQAQIKQTYQAYAQAQAKINTTRVHGQAQAWIEQTYNAFAQAQAYILVTAIEGFGQAQADIKQTYNAYAQAQADIKQTYNAFAQAQATLATTSRGYGQAQAWIEQTYNAFAQAQADIKQTYNAFAQAQADIKQTYRGYGQAQACVKGNAFGQAQAWIEATYNAYAQAQAEIKQTYNAYAQAQAWIEQTYNGCGQSQADIKQTYNAFAQANAWIEQTYVGCGQAQACIKGNAFGQAQADIKATSNAYGQAQAQIKQTYFGFAQANSNIEATINSCGQAQADIKQTYRSYAQTQAQIKQVYNAYGQAQAEIKQTYIACAQAQADIKTTYNAFAQAQAWIEQTYQQYGQAQADIKATYQAYGQAQADIKATYNACAQAQGYIKVTDVEACGQAQAQIKQTYQGYAQAQARLIAFGVKAFGQANASISFTGNAAYAQAQAKLRSFGYPQWGQAQADIKATYRGYAQAQADIEQTYNQYAQAQADILQTYNGYGQAQADIKQTYQAYGQAQALIVVTNIEGCGQAQGTIKQTYNSYAQAQATIKATSNGYGQANCSILGAKLAYAQAQGTIKAAGRGYGQAQADIKATSNGYGQAQGDIKQTYNGYGQANCYIKVADIEACAQAQASIKSTYQNCAQAQADIKAITNVCSQAQADIKTTYQGHAQAQAYILILRQGYGQAQATIEATTSQYGQANADILATTNRYGQAQALIVTKNLTYAQAQANIKVITNGYGQAAGLITSGTAGYGQAQAHILRTENGSGQAQATIVKAAGYGQAAGYIFRTHTLANVEVSDDTGITVTLSDDSIDSDLDDESEDILSTIDDDGITVTLDDEQAIIVTLSDDAYI